MANLRTKHSSRLQKAVAAEREAASSKDGRPEAPPTDINEDERRYRAGFATDHPPHGAVVAQKYLEPIFGPDAPWWDHLVALNEQIKRTKRGDLSDVEAMLVTQARALDAIFTGFAARASQYAEKCPGAMDNCLRLALKAQAQCRSTLEALAEIKSPRPVAFVRQANIANGPQQVNNDPTYARAENPGKSANELLESDHGEWMDVGAAGTASRDDPALETVGEFDRPSDGYGETRRVAQRNEARHAFDKTDERTARP